MRIETRGNYKKKTVKTGDKKGCEDEMIKEEETTEESKTTKGCQLAGMLCSLWVLSSK